MPTFKTFKDKRDGRIYKCVLMPDGKWWSAENLAWQGAGRDYGDVPENRSTYGRLYTHEEATTSIPVGSHLPSSAEWENLSNLCGGVVAGTALKSTTLWAEYVGAGNGTNIYGLDIRPGGKWFDSYQDIGSIGDFWAKDSNIYGNYTYGDYVNFYYYNTNIYFGATLSYLCFSVRFIVDTFPVEFLHKQITSVSNLQFQTANRQFKSESGSYHTLGSQGRPVLKGTLTYDLATSEEEALFDGWFSVEDPWDNDDFPGIGSVTIQAVSIPKKTHTEKGISISLDVVIFPNPNSGTFPWSTGSVPVMTPYAGVEAGFGSSVEQSLVTTSGRSTARKPTGDRGETFTISWTTTLYSALVFLEWYVHIGNGRKQFLGSLCGKTAWLWKIVGSPNMAISLDMVKIGMTVNGRNVNRALPVTIVMEM